jgi:hypothetical protein
MFKDLTERWSVQYRAEVFNIASTSQWSSPGVERAELGFRHDHRYTQAGKRAAYANGVHFPDRQNVINKGSAPSLGGDFLSLWK